MTQTPQNGKIQVNTSKGDTDGPHKAALQTVRPDFSKARKYFVQPEQYNQTAQWLTLGHQNGNVPTTTRRARSPKGFL